MVATPDSDQTAWLSMWEATFGPLQAWAGGDPTQTLRPVMACTNETQDATQPTTPHKAAPTTPPARTTARFNDAGRGTTAAAGDATEAAKPTVLMTGPDGPVSTGTTAPARDTSDSARGDDTPPSRRSSTAPLPPRQLTDNPLLLGCQEIDYDLLDVVGYGGMGVVHRAHQRRLVRDIAVKRIRPERLPSRIGSDDTELRQLERQFVAESLITGHLDHPNIVPVYDLGLDERGQLYLTMKLVGGRPWSRLLRPRCDEDRQAAAQMDQTDHLQVLLSVCNALVFAHDRHILHRDLKPANIMIGRYGEVLVMDWGMAAQFGPLADEQLRAPHVREIHSAGGTPAYMPPEMARCRGAEQGPWTDTYLLGAILYEIVSGAPPHLRADATDSLAVAAAGLPPRLPEGVGPGLSAILERALDPDHHRRYQGVADLQHDLRDHLRHRESEVLAGRGQRELAAAGDADARYDGYVAAIAAMDQALELWPDNAAARAGGIEARLAYAEKATATGDLNLAEDLLARLAPAAATSHTAEATTHPPLAPEMQERIARAHDRLADERERRVRAQRSQRRLRQALVALAALLFVGLSVGMILVDDARRQAATERDRAAAERGTAEAMADRALAGLERDFAHGVHLAPLEPLARDILAYYRHRLAGTADYPDPQRVGQVLHCIVTINHRLDRLPAAREAAALAHDFQAALLAKRDLPARRHALARSRLDLATIEHAQGRIDAAVAQLSATMELVTDDAGVPQRVQALLLRAQIADEIDDRAAATAAADQALELARAATPSPSQRHRLARTLTASGRSAVASGSASHGREILRRAVALAQDLCREFPRHTRYRSALAAALHHLGWAGRDRPAAALTPIRRAVAECQQVCDRSADDRLHRFALARSTVALGRLLARTGSRRAARHHLEQARDLLASLLTPDRPRPAWLRLDVICGLHLARLVLDENQRVLLERACEHAAAVVATLGTHATPDDHYRIYRSRWMLANNHRDHERRAAALTGYEQADAGLEPVRERVLERPGYLAAFMRARCDHAAALLHAGQTAAARDLLLETAALVTARARAQAEIAATWGALGDLGIQLIDLVEVSDEAPAASAVDRTLESIAAWFEHHRRPDEQRYPYLHPQWLFYRRLADHAPAGELRAFTALATAVQLLESQSATAPDSRDAHLLPSLIDRLIVTGEALARRARQADDTATAQMAAQALTRTCPQRPAGWALLIRLQAAGLTAGDDNARARIAQSIERARAAGWTPGPGWRTDPDLAAVAQDPELSALLEGP